MATAAAEILRKTREILETRGWAQDDGSQTTVLFPSDGPTCLYLAFFAAKRELGYPNHETVTWAARQALSTVTGSNQLTVWNDHPGRTVEEVYAVIDQAIELVS